ncbi:TetR/AcrR family transcriptional regulator C-terminal domain-containing protein [Mycetocola miduiensis]|uniref:TetR/AcrR family transcriptional regulator C-terminal domain-containing protein n=1 Tax=Mycetocola miduiensis TaxID=995034 RepID=UPI001FE8009C|nr:TetR/AcrR family transcriptional regulator C-terminal domain-containing protein [Mycetocola miduiensis]
MALADSGGIESLSMRKLAGELGVEAMSLYYHVKNKDELLDGMVGLVVSEMAVPAADDAWKPAMRERSESAREVLKRHPWAISQVDARNTRATLHYLNATIGCLVGAGFSIPLAAHAMSLLDSYVHGFALQESSLPLDEAGDIGAVTEDILAQQEMMSGAFPFLGRMATELILQPGYAYGNEFAFGLGIILDGIEASLEAR